MKFRINEWIDTETVKPKFGIQAQNFYGKWVHCVKDRQIVLFDNIMEAMTECNRLTNVEHKK